MHPANITPQNRRAFTVWLNRRYGVMTRELSSITEPSVFL